MDNLNENLFGRQLSPSESLKFSQDMEKAATPEEKMEILVGLFADSGIPANPAWFFPKEGKP